MEASQLAEILEHTQAILGHLSGITRGNNVHLYSHTLLFQPVSNFGGTLYASCHS